jgi:cell division protein FtsB
MLLAGPKLFDENKKLRNENKEVRAENKELKDKIEKMQSQRGLGSREGGKYAE